LRISHDEPIQLLEDRRFEESGIDRFRHAALGEFAPLERSPSEFS
jgi:hypothetical protein